MSKYLVATAAVLLAAFAPLARATDTQEKYKQPDLPPAELADLTYDDADNSVHVMQIDGKTVTAGGSLWSLQDKDFHVYVTPGIHVLIVHLKEGYTSAYSYNTIRTEASPLLVDLKKGHRYIFSPWYFRNGAQLRFTKDVEQERTEIARTFTPDNPDKFPWLQNVFFEIEDITDLPDRKFRKAISPDLRWLRDADWKYDPKLGGSSAPLTLADLDKQIANNPQDPWPHRLRGLAETWTSKPDYDKALAEATKAIELNPSWVRGYEERALVWSYKGKVDREIEDLSKAIELNPAFRLALLLRGHA